MKKNCAKMGSTPTLIIKFKVVKERFELPPALAGGKLNESSIGFSQKISNLIWLKPIVISKL